MNISLFEGGTCVYHLELERLFNEKHFGLVLDGPATDKHIEIVPTLLEHVLPRNGWKIKDVDAICMDTIQWFMMLYPDVELRAITAELHYSPDPRRPADWRKSIWKGREIYSVAVMHHLSHMAYSFYSGPFKDALVFVYDGLGEFDINTTWGVGKKGKLTYIGDFTCRRPSDIDNNSIGFLYTYLGHIIKFLYANTMDSPGKAMGLSSYGTPQDDMRSAIRKKIRGYIRDWKDFQGIIGDLSLDLADFVDPNSQVAKDFMATIQDEAELYTLETISKLVKRTGLRNLCLGGGVALNVQINQRLLDEGVVDAIHIPPACSDTGNAIGSGLYFWHNVLGNKFIPKEWHSPYLGDEVYARNLIHEDPDIASRRFAFPELLYAHVATELANNKIVGWAQGRAEIGPRALGNRSILANPTSPTMKDNINLKVKHRDYWRPFAPVCMAEHASEWFETDIPHPYMLMAPKIRENKLGLIPAVTHVDGTARLQTVTRQQNPKLYSLLKHFYKRTGVPILLNTSLNDRGKPIANDARVIVDLVKHTGMDMAVIGSTVYTKSS